MKRKLISLLMAGTLALSLAACGGSSSAPAADSNADAAAEETQAEEAPAESAEAADETAGASGKVWKIVTDTAFKPFEYTDDNGDFVGIDMLNTPMTTAILWELIWISWQRSPRIRVLPMSCRSLDGTLPSQHARPVRRMA